ncbi:MAG TPA: hypothetical protein VG871_09655 [Vicinamibacterales bacterium]|nr:hypothetical protein [Vicinamibacterales bacterium]
MLRPSCRPLAVNRRRAGAAAVLLGVSLAASSSGRAWQAPAPPPAATTDPFPSKGALISEVLFQPAAGASPFVELVNTGAAPVEIGTMLLRIGDQGLPLGHLTEPLAPGARVLIVFDGGGAVSSGVVHTPMGMTLPQDSGAVDLLNYKNDVIDRVAWGSDMGAVSFGSGIPNDAPPPGSTIGRPPGANHPLQPGDWIVYAPADATPGAANPLPAVEPLVPIDGAGLPGPTVTLSWYPIAGAAQYRVQVSRDDAFASLQMNTVVAGATVDAGALPAGAYVWRVQAIDADGKTSAFSAPSGFDVRASGSAPAASTVRQNFVAALAPAAATLIPARWASAAFAGPASQTPPAAPATCLPPSCNILAVPLIVQHKDTSMLLLEEPDKSGAHAWNVDHGVLDLSDPADKANCVLAAVAMLNHFFGGDLSQDRIGYEIRGPHVAQYAAKLLAGPQSGRLSGYDLSSILEEKQPGPEWDLNFGTGLNWIEEAAAVTFALDVVPIGDGHFTTPDEAWNAIRTSINRGRPVIGGYPFSTGSGGHEFVVKGYREANGQRFIVVNDPLGSSYEKNIDSTRTPIARLQWMFLPGPDGTQFRGHRQEPALTREVDSDFDGVLDFDETERFHTDPHNRDSDGDGVWDKADIASGVFDDTYGYARHTASPKGRDFDGDGLPTERDPDSDNGGCTDGIEDEDGNGDRDVRETWNFDDGDDVCRGVNGVLKWTTVVRFTVPEAPDFSLFIAETGRITLRLKGDPTRTGGLLDDGSTFRAEHSAQVIVFRDAGCTAFGREFQSGSGAFRGDPGNEIGGMRDQTSLVIGAGGPIDGHSFANLCVFSGGGPMASGFSFPDCEGHADPNAPGTYVFDCRAPAIPPPPNYKLLVWSVTGRVTVR